MQGRCLRNWCQFWTLRSLPSKSGHGPCAILTQTYQRHLIENTKMHLCYLSQSHFSFKSQQKDHISWAHSPQVSQSIPEMREQRQKDTGLELDRSFRSLPTSAVLRCHFPIGHSLGARSSPRRLKATRLEAAGPSKARHRRQALCSTSVGTERL